MEDNHTSTRPSSRSVALDDVHVRYLPIIYLESEKPPLPPSDGTTNTTKHNPNLVRDLNPSVQVTIIIMSEGIKES